MIRTEFFTGPAIAAQLPSLSALRMQVFRAWPYLYDGSLPSEADTLSSFAQSKTAGIAIAFDGHAPVGASTCVHMPEEDDHVTLPFRQAGIDLASICYFGESVLLEAYRGQGIGVRFFELREAHAQTMPGVTTTAFCAVQRPDEHPLKPPGVVPLDAFWRKRGYAPTDLACKMVWKQTDSADKVENTLRFWTKRLAG
jgi:GNAT superfamily N-acetyltransferase